MLDAWDTHWAELWELVENCDAAERLRSATVEPGSREELEAYLAKSAEALRRQDDILGGDFSRFRALEREPLTDEERYGVGDRGDPGLGGDVELGRTGAIVNWLRRRGRE